MNGDHAGKAKPSGSSVYVARVGWIVVLKLPVTFLNAITFFTRYTRQDTIVTVPGNLESAPTGETGRSDLDESQCVGFGNWR